VTKPDNGVVRPTSRPMQTATHGGVGVAELTHADVRSKLSEYLDDALDPGDRRRVEGHLVTCRPCGAYLATLRATVRATEALPRPKAPTNARARILERVRREAANGAASDVSATEDSAPTRGA